MNSCTIKDAFRPTLLANFTIDLRFNDKSSCEACSSIAKQRLLDIVWLEIPSQVAFRNLKFGKSVTHKCKPILAPVLDFKVFIARVLEYFMPVDKGTRVLCC
jgi:hypothetical protein